MSISPVRFVILCSIKYDVCIRPDMKIVSAFYLCAPRKAKCDQLIESGVFDTMSGLMDFALRLYLMDSVKRGAPTYIWRQPPYVRINARANGWVMEKIVEKEYATTADMGDYALEHLFQRLDGMESDAAASPGAGVRELEQLPGADVGQGGGSVAEGDEHSGTEASERSDVGDIVGDAVYRDASHRNRSRHKSHLISLDIMISVERSACGGGGSYRMLRSSRGGVPKRL